MKIYYYSDGAPWVIKEIGLSLEKELASKGFSLSKRPGLQFSGIKHLATRYDALKLRLPNPFVKTILTYFHGDDQDREMIEAIAKKQKLIDIFHTSCLKTKEHLTKYGIEDEKIVIIPIGIEVDIFSPVSLDQKNALRNKYNLPHDKIIIGSFQKDGNGWEDGLEPKLCKGPDLFCDAIIEINKKIPLHIFLTGPSRGYVKNRLADAGISFTHQYLDDYSKIAECYNTLDLYLVSSRLEGGPRAPMECQASGVPVISTNVGQVPDMIQDRENGLIVKVEDTNDMVKKAIEILENKELKNRIVQNGLQTVKRFDYKIIAQDYFNKLYLPLMK